MKLIFITVLFLLSEFAVGQGTDTIFYNKDWLPTQNQDNAKYYRLYEENDSIVKVFDYYRNNNIQMTGSYKLPERNMTASEFFKNSLDSLKNGIATGVFIWYKKNGRKDYATIYDPINNTKNVYLIDVDLSKIDDSLKSRITYEISFFRNGGVEEKGLLIDEYYRHGVWISYWKKSNTVYYKIEYDYGLKHGTEELFYSDGNSWKSTEYVNGQKSGEQIKYGWYNNPKKKKIYLDGELVSTEKLEQRVFP